jgi:hypothetical protein
MTMRTFFCLAPILALLGSAACTSTEAPSAFKPQDHAVKVGLDPNRARPAMTQLALSRRPRGATRP